MQFEATFLTITQAAKFLKVSPDTLRRWEAKGIVTPQRTKGGSRRYTLLDLKIAKLNKRKREQVLSSRNRFFQIPTFLRQNYLSSKRDLKIALLTSFLWIFALLAYNFLTPIFLRPTNPEQQIVSDELKEQTRLKIASETTRDETNAIKTLVNTKYQALPNTEDQTPVANKITPSAISQVSDLLIDRLSNLPTLKYTETLDNYYLLQPLPQNQIPTLIKRT